MRQVYEWDAENRLTKTEPAETPEERNLKVEFAYYYHGRRVERKVSIWTNGARYVTDQRRFIWDGWLMLLEIGECDSVLRKCTWGLDLSRDRERAAPSSLQPLSLGRGSVQT
ncbi:MAG: hypothetical protein KKB50_14985 [Planctomycetes bacterium]|nr:hypothetical protein [Planctomycetota bacterium]